MGGKEGRKEGREWRMSSCTYLCVHVYLLSINSYGLLGQTLGTWFDFWYIFLHYPPARVNLFLYCLTSVFPCPSSNPAFSVLLTQAHLINKNPSHCFSVHFSDHEVNNFSYMSLGICISSYATCILSLPTFGLRVFFLLFCKTIPDKAQCKRNRNGPGRQVTQAVQVLSTLFVCTPWASHSGY